MTPQPVADRWINACLFDINPIVTLTAMDPEELHLFDMMKAFPQIFEKRQGIHFVCLTWTIETLDLQPIAKALFEQRTRFPGHVVVMVANTEFETFRWSSLGIKCIMTNASIFQDETRWTIEEVPYPGLPRGTALYNAHFAPFKRHELCAQLDRPLFIHGFDPNDKGRRLSDRVLEQCPSAVLVNEALNDNTYRYLDEHEISRVSASASTALCLSAAEGHMRASIQALLCGLPVVSTPSIGGRDRYYTDDNALIVEPTPQAVADGVRQMTARGLSRQDVRRSALSLIAADRRAFVQAVNRILAAQFGPDYPEFQFADVAGWKYSTKAIKDLVAALSSH